MVGCKRVTTVLERLWGGGGSLSFTSESGRSDGDGDGDSPELADLVDSFYSGDEEGVDGLGGGCGAKVMKKEREVLVRLVGGEMGLVGRRVREEVEAIVAGDGVDRVEMEGKGLKRIVMACLRDQGFDAALCKSRPEGKTSRFPPGRRHEYIDVTAADNTRYIVDLNLAAEFQIARPTPEYASLLSAFPAVFVGRPETLREIVGVMCNAAKESLRRRDMHVPPWRRREYMLAKWFGCCKRSTKGASEKKKLVAAGGGGKYCGVECGRRELEWEKWRLEVGLGVGNYMC